MKALEPIIKAEKLEIYVRNTVHISGPFLLLVVVVFMLLNKYLETPHLQQTKEQGKCEHHENTISKKKEKEKNSLKGTGHHTLMMYGPTVHHEST